MVKNVFLRGAAALTVAGIAVKSWAVSIESSYPEY